jgi:hypothetical protein
VLELVGEGTPLEPGRYRFSPFDPPLTFEVAAGWEGGHTHVEFFDVWYGEDVSVGFARPAFVNGVDGPVEIGRLTPRGVLDTIAGRGFEVSDVASTTIGEVPALEMRFRVEETTALFGGPEGELNIEPRFAQRAITLDVDRTLVVILVQTVGPAPEDAIDALLSSVRFET